MLQKPILILFYDTMWSTGIPQMDLPEGFHVTTDRGQYAQAQVVVFHIPEWKWKPRWLFPKKQSGQLWVAWSMECFDNYPRLHDPTFMRAFDATMTYRLDSDVPVIYFGAFSSMAQALEDFARPPGPRDARKPAVSFISSRFNKSKRREYVRELMRYVDTDSYGSFLHNVRVKRDLSREHKLETIARYPFTLAFENAIAHDYVTEKFYDPLLAGSLPVYLGAPNAADFAPGEHCFVNVADFSGPRALADYMHSLLADEAAYAAYFEWKKKPLRAEFLEQIAPFKRNVQLRLCDWLERKMREQGT